MPRPAMNPDRPAVRFAPSPNGLLHLGHAFSALFADGVARALSARFIVRIEDIDSARARPYFIDQILDDLAWLGLEWDEPVRRQSAHMDDYARALDRLGSMDLLYASSASRGDVAHFVAAREAEGAAWPRDPDGAPLFPGIGRTGSSDGGAGALRIDMAKALGSVAACGLCFTEIGPERASLRPVPADPGKWGDAILARRDIATSYHLSVVVDDAIQAITHVTRGMDLYEATHLHRLLQALLGLPAPVYCHHRLITDAAGRKLAKTRASVSLKALREGGATAADIRAATGIDRWSPWFERLAGEKVSRTFPG